MRVLAIVVFDTCDHLRAGNWVEYIFYKHVTPSGPCLIFYRAEYTQRAQFAQRLSVLQQNFTCEQKSILRMLIKHGVHREIARRAQRQNR